MLGASEARGGGGAMGSSGGGRGYYMPHRDGVAPPPQQQQQQWSRGRGAQQQQSFVAAALPHSSYSSCSGITLPVLRRYDRQGSRRLGVGGCVIVAAVRCTTKFKPPLRPKASLVTCTSVVGVEGFITLPTFARPLGVLKENAVLAGSMVTRSATVLSTGLLDNRPT